MSIHEMGPLKVSDLNPRGGDIQICEFPVHLIGKDVRLVMPGLYASKDPRAKRVAAVKFHTSDTASIVLADGVVIEVAYVPVSEPQCRGRHVLVRTSGDTEHDLGVSNVHEGRRHTAMVQHSLLQYWGWDTLRR